MEISNSHSRTPYSTSPHEQSQLIENEPKLEREKDLSMQKLADDVVTIQSGNFETMAGGGGGTRPPKDPEQPKDDPK